MFLLNDSRLHWSHTGLFQVTALLSSAGQRGLCFMYALLLQNLVLSYENPNESYLESLIKNVSPSGNCLTSWAVVRQFFRWARRFLARGILYLVNLDENFLLLMENLVKYFFASSSGCPFLQNKLSECPGSYTLSSHGPRGLQTCRIRPFHLLITKNLTCIWNMKNKSEKFRSNFSHDYGSDCVHSVFHSSQS